MHHLLLTLAQDALPEGLVRRFVPPLPAHQAHLSAFLALRHAQGVTAWVDRCPHWQVPLSMPDTMILARQAPSLTCLLHRARFDAVSGDCLSGPCYGDRLEPVPAVEAMGQLFFFLPRSMRKC